MTGQFRVALYQGEACIVDESFTAQSVEQIIECKPEDVSRVEAVKVRDIEAEPRSDEAVWLELVSMRENLVEAWA